MNLTEQIEKKRREMEHLERLAASATCLELGHDWKCIGGQNAGCDLECWCSVPVKECARCGNCDYGENDEAENIKTECIGETAQKEV